MPATSRFSHARHSTEPPELEPCVVELPEVPKTDSPEWAERLRAVGARYLTAGIDSIYLVHGTFVGDDVLGGLTEVERYVSAPAAWGRRMVKAVTDKLFGSHGNYPAEFAEQLQSALAQPDGTQIPVRRFFWSGMNNHVGRAEAAIRLVCRLHDDGVRHPLILAHSHGGNVLALFTELIHNDPEAIEEFFAAAHAYARQHVFGRQVRNCWDEARRDLEDTQWQQQLQCDIVTFGMPPRYGWHRAGYRRLLHIVNHTCHEHLPRHATRSPPTVSGLLRGTQGDVVQQIGIAGTNFPSFPWPRAMLADLRLGRRLEHDCAPPRRFCRLRCGIPVSCEGQTLLVDYGKPNYSFPFHMAGHAVYTEPENMLPHAEWVADFLEGTCPPSVKSGESTG